MKFLKVGSDPECFLVDSANNIVSSLDVRLPGTKDKPFNTPNGSIQKDNILAEFNSVPASTLFDFINNHNLIINDLKDIIRPLDLNLNFIASALCDRSLLDDPRAMTAGCEPDWNVWTGEINRKPNYRYTNVRAAGGHVHISFDQAVDSQENKLKMVRALDLVLCLPSVLIDPDTARRQFYGMAGSYRPKDKANNARDPYDGIEYRSLSNFWLKDESLMAFVWNGIELAYNNLDELSSLATRYKDKLVSFINTSDSDGAKALLSDLGISYAL